MTNKKSEYSKLVAARKEFIFSDGLINPSGTAYDTDEIEPWAQWQNNLDAKILAIGQEFCDVDTFNKCRGTVELPNDKEYPANTKLRGLFQLIGIDIGSPLAPNVAAPVFLTNAVMGLKSGSMSANFKDKWLKESREMFLVPLINIIKPKLIITLGTKSLLSVSKIYGFTLNSLKSEVEGSPIEVDGDVTIFPVFHPGSLGLANRNSELQKADWLKIGEFYKSLD
jgi:hypothetical protein